MSQTSINALYLIEWVNQVGNVFTDTLKLRGEESQFRNHTGGTVWPIEMYLWCFVLLKDSISTEENMILSP